MTDKVIKLYRYKRIIIDKNMNNIKQEQVNENTYSCFFTEKGGIIMAIYHCSVQVISRSTGRSVVAASAYRSGTKMTSVYDGITSDYTKKKWITKMACFRFLG